MADDLTQRQLDALTAALITVIQVLENSTLPTTDLFARSNLLTARLDLEEIQRERQQHEPGK